jgi:hypothetical protein
MADSPRSALEIAINSLAGTVDLLARQLPRDLKSDPSLDWGLVGADLREAMRVTREASPTVSAAMSEADLLPAAEVVPEDEMELVEG